MESLPARPEPSRPFSEVVRAWLQWFGVGRLAVSAFAILAVGAGGYWLLRAPPTPVESSLPYAGGAGASAATSSTVLVVPQSSSIPNESAAIVVYVAGAVASPGVYSLSADARVQQAIGAAGGAIADADLDSMNLAAPIRDGDRVYVPHVGVAVPVVVGASGASGTTASSGHVAGPIDLNRASVDELDGLPGIGPATAAAIVTYREQKGPFSSVDDLLGVPGIGPAKVEAIRSLVKV
jgi:competence protein ComEA